MREILQDTSCRGHLMPNAKKKCYKEYPATLPPVCNISQVFA